MTALRFTIDDDRARWISHLGNSPQGSFFCHPDWLDLFGADYRFCYLEKDGHAHLGAPLIDAGRFGNALPFSYYQGLVFANDLWRARPYKRTQHALELSEQLLTQLAGEVDGFRFSLHHSLSDVRGIDWVHYHEPDKGRVTLRPRYTAIFDLSSTADGQAIRAQGRSARRQEERYGRERDSLVVGESATVAPLLALYEESFTRQGLVADTAERDMIRTIGEALLAWQRGTVLTVCDAQGEILAAALVFRDLDGTLHVPVVGTGEHRHAGTMLYYAILDHGQASDAPAVDFNGANSPNRAYFKHSVGAEARLYFEAIWKRPAQA